MHCHTEVEHIPSAAEIETLPEGVCPVKWAKQLVAAARKAACGKTVLCRDGLTQLALLIDGVTTGRGSEDDLETIGDIVFVMSEAEGCPLVKKVAAELRTSMEIYQEEWFQHCMRKRCSALACEAYYSVYIDPILCKGCHACVAHAPEGAILHGDGMISVILDDSELKDAGFAESCPCGAIKRSGTVKPRLPDSLVPVGSFGAAGGAPRRRRRS